MIPTPIQQNHTHVKKKIHTIIFGVDTRSGRIFDLILICAIMASVLVVILDSIDPLSEKYHGLFFYLEWFFTLMFTLEYGARVYSSVYSRRYIFSFFGLVDLISILPSYLGLFFVGSSYLIVIRILRILRIFRVLKLMQYVSEANYLLASIKRSMQKITVFFFFLILSAVIFGSIMYLIEGAENGFTNIPRSVYWAIVTMTTVGYGDISPQTPLGQTIASIIMILGYSVIAVPTGIISAELTLGNRNKKLSLQCSRCQYQETDTIAKFCKMCGNDLFKSGQAVKDK